MAERPDLIFVLDGDGHERRIFEARTEADAREQCANDFNSQYGCDCDGTHDDTNDDCSSGDYQGDEFDLVSVYAGDVDDESTWTKLHHWP